ncbi:hypothetical protein CBOM_04405 [Ceraceosorus bombacis]|uniref:Uncharacterized protein n=1 Tax=Ceraceosorus bombacis TaxID=401625 RepID=A0A0N7LAZ6_9BASI|nr:hypothetical protein CBOM_04405 [Ceraceosorus bombacis]
MDAPLTNERFGLLLTTAFARVYRAFHTNVHTPTRTRIDKFKAALKLGDHIAWLQNLVDVVATPFPASNASAPDQGIRELLEEFYPDMTLRNVETEAWCVYLRYLGTFTLSTLLKAARDYADKYPSASANARVTLLEREVNHYGPDMLRRLCYIGLTTTGTAIKRARNDKLVATSPKRKASMSWLGYLLRYIARTTLEVFVLVSLRDKGSKFDARELHALEGLFLEACNPLRLANTACGSSAQRFAADQLRRWMAMRSSEMLSHIQLGEGTLAKDWTVAHDHAHEQAHMLILHGSATSKDQRASIVLGLSGWLMELGIINAGAIRLTVKSPHLMSSEELSEDLDAILCVGESEYRELLRLDSAVIAHPDFDSIGRGLSADAWVESRVHPINAVPDVLEICASVPVFTTLSTSFPAEAHLAEIHRSGIQQMFAAAAWMCLGADFEQVADIMMSLNFDYLAAVHGSTGRVDDFDQTTSPTGPAIELEMLFVVAQTADLTIVGYVQLLETIGTGLAEPLYNLWRRGMLRSGTAFMNNTMWQRMYTNLLTTLLNTETSLDLGLMRMHPRGNAPHEVHFVLPQVSASVSMLANAVSQTDACAENQVAPASGQAAFNAYASADCSRKVFGVSARLPAHKVRTMHQQFQQAIPKAMDFPLHVKYDESAGVVRFMSCWNDQQEKEDGHQPFFPRWEPFTQQRVRDTFVAVFDITILEIVASIPHDCAPFTDQRMHTLYALLSMDADRHLESSLAHVWEDAHLVVHDHEVTDAWYKDGEESVKQQRKVGVAALGKRHAKAQLQVWQESSEGEAHKTDARDAKQRAERDRDQAIAEKQQAEVKLNEAVQEKADADQARTNAETERDNVSDQAKKDAEIARNTARQEAEIARDEAIAAATDAKAKLTEVICTELRLRRSLPPVNLQYERFGRYLELLQDKSSDGRAYQDAFCAPRRTWLTSQVPTAIKGGPTALREYYLAFVLARRQRPRPDAFLCDFEHCQAVQRLATDGTDEISGIEMGPSGLGIAVVLQGTDQSFLDDRFTVRQLSD